MLTTRNQNKFVAFPVLSQRKSAPMMILTYHYFLSMTIRHGMVAEYHQVINLKHKNLVHIYFKLLSVLKRILKCVKFSILSRIPQVVWHCELVIPKIVHVKTYLYIRQVFTCTIFGNTIIASFMKYSLESNVLLVPTN